MRVALVHNPATETKSPLTAVLSQSPVNLEAVKQKIEDAILDLNLDNAIPESEEQQQIRNFFLDGGFDAGETACIINGRVIKPKTEILTIADLETLISFELDNRVHNIAKAVKGLFVDQSKSKSELSDIILKITALIAHVSKSTKTERFDVKQFMKFSKSEMYYSLISYFSAGDELNSPFRLTAVVHPLSNTGQMILSALDVLISN